MSKSFFVLILILAFCGLAFYKHWRIKKCNEKAQAESVLTYGWNEYPDNSTRERLQEEYELKYRLLYCK